MKRAELQSLSDAAAIAAAKEMAIANSNQSSIEGAARAFVVEQVSGDKDRVDVAVDYDRKAGKVNVKISEAWTPFLAQYLGASVTPVVTEATAALTGAKNVCVLALDGGSGGAIKLTKGAKMTAPSCAVYSNSKATDGITVDTTAMINSDFVCSGGGVSYTPGSIKPDPTSDCSVLADPLAARPAPKVSACTATNLKITSGVVTLNPGVYCGGIEIINIAAVTFAPGDYIIKDGPFKVAGLTFARGKNVGFFLTGAASKLDFTGGSTVEFSGRETGDLAGLLFYEDRTNPAGQNHRINTLLTLELTGTIYLPNGNLLVDPQAQLGKKSAYTAIVVSKLELRDGPELLLNTNYGATSVPVPAGIRSTATAVLQK
jgi:hypothetical protein